MKHPGLALNFLSKIALLMNSSIQNDEHSSSTPSFRLICKKIHYPCPPVADDDQSHVPSIEIRKRRLGQALQLLFEPFHATEIFLPDHRRKHYAIVYFATSRQAQNAIESIALPHALFDELKVCHTKRDNNEDTTKTKQVKQKSKRQIQREETIRDMKQVLTDSEISLILQVTKSHIDRFADVLDQSAVRSKIQFIHSHQSTSLLFLETSQPAALLNYLHSQWYIQDNLQRSFILRPDHPDSPSDKNSSYHISSHLLEVPTIQTLLQDTHHPQGGPAKASEGSDCAYKIRVQVYPPRIQQTILQRMEKARRTFVSNLEGTHDRTLATHVLNVLELVPPINNDDGTRGDEENDGLVLTALVPNTIIEPKGLPPIPTAGDDTSIHSTATTSATCRAYWKLAEACQRYPHALPNKGGSGMDVGSAPGGWTQYLIQARGLSKVYSIDPGDMDSSVLALQADVVVNNDSTKRAKVAAVEHVRATYQVGVPQIAKDRQDLTVTSDKSGKNHLPRPVQWYVSDMCVKNIEEQVDALFLAAKEGLVQVDTFCILTIKCNRGYSKGTFDALAQTQVDRLLSGRHMRDLQVIHLFSNRSSERTIIGYWIA